MTVLEMRKQENIARREPVVWSRYENKLDQVDILFHFISYALEHLSRPKRKEFVKSLKQEKEIALAKSLEKLRRLTEIDPSLSEILGTSFDKDFEQNQRKKIKANYLSKTHTQYAEWVNDGMVSAKILFFVTIFEDFLKHVHAATLNADTKILASSKPKRQSTYDEIFLDSFEQFKTQQICREVEELDKQGMEKRLDYFAQHLQIDFGKERIWLEEISYIRNKIAHGNPLEAITKEDTTMPLENIQTTITKIIREAMRFAFDKGQSKHPRHFLLK